MRDVHIAAGIALLVTNGAAGSYGALAWSRGIDAPGFWPLVRVAQALVVVQAVIGGIAVIGGSEPPELHLVYGLTPIGVHFAAEQLRVISAETVLDRRGLETAQAMRALAESEQLAIVQDIRRREIGVMAAACGVVVALAARAAGLY